MRSKIAQKILDETPRHVEIFTAKYADIVVRIHKIIKEKKFTQKDLAEKLGKTPSEVSKWLSGNHNLTLRTLARLEAELGEEIISIPKTPPFQKQQPATLYSTYRKVSHSKAMEPRGNWTKANRKTIKIKRYAS